MSEIKQQKIVCASCGRVGPYRPEFAGKRVKCKCGNVITVPITAPVEEEKAASPQPTASVPSEAVPDGLYGLAEELPAPVRKLPTLAPPVSAAPGGGLKIGGKQGGAAPLKGKAEPGSKGKGDEAAKEEKAKFIRMIVLVGAIVIVIAAAIVGIKVISGRNQNIAGAPLPGEDAAIEEKLANETHMEIHAWYKEDSSRIAGPWTPQQAIGFADRWQGWGAKQVIAFGSAYTQFLVIELPTQPEKRKPVFDWQEQWHKDHHFKVWTDVGQKYLMIDLGN